MAMAKTLAVAPQRLREAAPRRRINLQHRLAAALRRLLSELSALPDRGPLGDDLPSEFFRFPPF